jgi:hypothetical protein
MLWSLPRWLRRRLKAGRLPKAAKPTAIRARFPYVKPLEVRWLFSQGAWLPEKLTPLDGIPGYYQSGPVFRPAVLSLDPSLAFNSGSVAIAGSFSLNDTGVFTLSFSESGPDGTGSFTFYESGTVTFALTELGTFTANGFSTNSISLTETVSLAWSFTRTNSSGQTVTYRSGNTSLTTTSYGANPYDPYFWGGFNWQPPTAQLSQNKNLGLANLTATSLSASEGGSESFTFQETNAVATVQGTGKQPLAGLSQTGQQSYSGTSTDSFTLTQQGSNTFTLSEQGAYANGSYALSSVAWNELGSHTLTFTGTVVQSQGGTGSAAGAQSFSGNNHSLGNTSSESFQFTGLSTAVYSETDSDSFTRYQGGSYGGGSFALSSLNFSDHGSGSYSLTETNSATQTGTLNLGGTGSGADSYSVQGTLTNSGTLSEAGNFTQTSAGTVTETGSGNFTVTEQGSYGNGSWSLSSYSLSESASGAATVQQQDTFTASGPGTFTDTGSGSDSYSLNYSPASTFSATDSASFAETQSYQFTQTATDSMTLGGSDSYSLSELGRAAGGSYSLSSYALRTGLSGSAWNYQANGTTTDAGNDTVVNQYTGSSNGSSSYGGVSGANVGNQNSTETSAYAFSDSSAYSLTAGGSLSLATYQAGSYGGGSYGFTSVTLSESGGDTWSLTGSDASTFTGTDTLTQGGNGQDNGTMVYGGSTFTGLSNGTYSGTSTDSYSHASSDTYSESGSDSVSYTRQGSYNSYVYAFASVAYQGSSNFSGTYRVSGSDTVSGTATDSFTGSANDSNNGAAGILAMSGLDSSSISGSDTFTFSGTDSATSSGTFAMTMSVSEAGSYGNGSYALSSVTYSETDQDTWSLTASDSSTASGTDTQTTNGSGQGNSTLAYAGSTLANLGNNTYTDQQNITFLSTANDSVTASGTGSGSLTEQGTFGNLSFAFGGLTYQSASTYTGTAQSSGTDSVTGTENDSYSLSNNLNNNTSSAVGSFNGLGKYSTRGTNTVSLSAYDTYSGTDQSTVTTSLFEAGSYVGGSYSLSSVSYSGGSADTFTIQAVDSAADSGTDSQTDTGTGQSTGTTVYGGGSFTGLDNGTFTSSSSDTFSDTSRDTLALSGTATASFYEGGSYGNFSFSYGSVVYRSGQSESSTFQLAATDSTTGASSGSYTESGNQGSTATYGATTESGLGTTTTSGADTSSYQVTDTYSYTDQSGGSYSVYEAGSYSYGSFALSSVNLAAAASDSFSFQATQSASDSGTDSATVNTSGQDNNTLAYSSGTFTGLLSGNVTTTSSDTVSDTANQTTALSGNSSISLTEQGVYGNYSFSFASTVYQASGSSNSTHQVSGADTITGASSDSMTQGNGFANNGIYGASQGSFQASVTVTGTDTLSAGANVTYNSTDVQGSSYTLYQAGSFSNGSFGLSSVVYTTGTSDSFSYQRIDGATESGGNSQGQAGRSAVGSNTNDALGGVGMTSAFTFVHTSTDTFALTASDTISQSGTSSTSVSEQGVYSAGSYSFASVVYRAGSSYAGAVQLSAVDTFFGTATDSRSVLLGNSNNLNVAYTDSSAAGTVSTAGLATAQFNGGNTVSTTDQYSGSASLYDAGSYGNGSYALSSVTYNTSGTATTTVQEADTAFQSATQSSTQTTTTAGTFNLNYWGFGSGGANNVTATRVLTASASVTSGNSVVQTDSSSHSLAESGTYGNGSFGFSNVVSQAGDAFSGTQTTTSQTGSNASGSDGSFASYNSNNTYGFLAYSGTGQGAFSATSSDTFTASGTDSRTQAGQYVGSYNLYQAGSYGDGFASGLGCLATYSLTSLTYNGGLNETFTYQDTAAQTVNVSAWNSYGQSGGSGPGASLGSGAQADLSSFAQTGATTLTLSRSSNNEAQGGGAVSFTVHEEGTYANQSYNLSSVVFNQGSYDTALSQQTTTSTQTVLTSGSAFFSFANTQTATYSGQTSSGGLVTVVSSQTGTLNDTVTSTTMTLASQVVVNANGTEAISLREQGIFTNGSYSLSSLVYDDTSLASFSSQMSDQATTNRGETLTGSYTANHNGVSTLDSYGGNGTAATNRIQTTTGTDTVTAYSVSTYTVHEEGTYGGGSYTKVSNQTNTDNSAWAETFSLTEVGSYGNGSFALTNYALSEAIGGTDTALSTSTSLETYSGVNNGNTYSGGQNETITEQDSGGQTASLSQQGQYTNGTFTLSAVVYQATLNQTFARTDNAASSWSGQYNGADTVSASGNANGSFTAYAAGSYAAGSYGLSTFSAQGGSTGTFTLQEASTASTSLWTSNVTRTVNAVESDQLYQTGTTPGGQTSYVSFNYSDTALSTTTYQSQTGATTGQQTDVLYNQVTQMGSGQTGTLVTTAWGTYTANGAVKTFGPTNSLTTVSLPAPAAMPPPPDATTIPILDPSSVQPGFAPGAPAPPAGPPVGLQPMAGLPPGSPAVPAATLLHPIPIGGPGSLAGRARNGVLLGVAATWNQVGVAYANTVQKATHVPRAQDPQGQLGLLMLDSSLAPLLISPAPQLDRNLRNQFANAKKAAGIGPDLGDRVLIWLNGMSFGQINTLNESAQIARVLVGEREFQLLTLAGGLTSFLIAEALTAGLAMWLGPIVGPGLWGALLTIGTNAAIGAEFAFARSGIQVAVGEREGIDWGEVGLGAVIGAAFGVVTLLPKIGPLVAEGVGLYMVGMGLKVGAAEIGQGHLATGLFDIIASAVALAEMAGGRWGEPVRAARPAEGMSEAARTTAPEEVVSPQTPPLELPGAGPARGGLPNGPPAIENVFQRLNMAADPQTKDPTPCFVLDTVAWQEGFCALAGAMPAGRPWWDLPWLAGVAALAAVVAPWVWAERHKRRVRVSPTRGGVGLCAASHWPGEARLLTWSLGAFRRFKEARWAGESGGWCRNAAGLWLPAELLREPDDAAEVPRGADAVEYDLPAATVEEVRGMTTRDIAPPPGEAIAEATTAWLVEFGARASAACACLPDTAAALPLAADAAAYGPDELPAEVDKGLQYDGAYPAAGPWLERIGLRSRAPGEPTATMASRAPVADRDGGRSVAARSRSTWKRAVTVALLLVAGLCFARGTADLLRAPQQRPPAARPALVPVPIQDVEVGDRMALDGEPRGDVDRTLGDDVDPATWREVALLVPEGDGWADVKLLRPRWWLEERRVRAGGTLALAVPECGIVGTARVVSVGPCPPIRPGKGRVVTGTFHHTAGRTLNVYLEGQAEPVGVMPNHRFWCPDCGVYVRADALRPGQWTDALQGRARVLVVVPRGGPEPVFNIEVQFSHVYRVGPAGVLVHNAYPDDPLAGPPLRQGVFWPDAEVPPEANTPPAQASAPGTVPVVGPTHHPISAPIARALADHPTLSGLAKRRLEFTTIADGQAAHRGYDTFHRNLDAEVIAWIRNPAHRGATPDEFLAWLRWRYSQPDLKARFPNGF